LIYLATSSAHKARELGRLIGRPVAPIPGYEPPAETGETFADNARIKASAGHTQAPPGSWVIADDSGLLVDALDGAPGVRSARFGGESLDDASRTALLVRALTGVEHRHAAYQCALVAAAPDGVITIVEGSLVGSIAHAPRGAGGFGYDPVFVPEGDIRTVAELSAPEKDAISHRGRAARALVQALGW
jgi:XTP/dITP diphosphohydrolase